MSFCKPDSTTTFPPESPSRNWEPDDDETKGVVKPHDVHRSSLTGKLGGMPGIDGGGTFDPTTSCAGLTSSIAAAAASLIVGNISVGDDL